MTQELKSVKNINIIEKCFQGELKVFYYKAIDGRIEPKPEIQLKQFLYLYLYEVSNREYPPMSFV